MFVEPLKVGQDANVPVGQGPNAVDEVGPRKMEALLGNLWRMESKQGLRARAEVSLNCSAWTCSHRFSPKPPASPEQQAWRPPPDPHATEPPPFLACSLAAHRAPPHSPP